MEFCHISKVEALDFISDLLNIVGTILYYIRQMLYLYTTIVKFCSLVVSLLGYISFKPGSFCHLVLSILSHET